MIVTLINMVLYGTDHLVEIVSNLRIVSSVVSD